MTTEDMAPGEIARTLQRLDDGQKELVQAQREDHQAVMAELSALGDKYIHRAEWDMQNRIFTAGLADLENDARDDRKAHANVEEQVATLKQHESRLGGMMAVLGVIVGIIATLLGSYIASGRL
jgi:hypothetical protein